MTQADVEWLISEGRTLLERGRRDKQLPKNQEAVRAWLKQVEAWMSSGLPADQQAAIDRASDRLRRHYVQNKGALRTGVMFMTDVEATVAAIEASRASAEADPAPAVA